MNTTSRPSNLALPVFTALLFTIATVNSPAIAQEPTEISDEEIDDLFASASDAGSIKREIERVEQTRHALQRRREIHASNAEYYVDWEGQISYQREWIAKNSYADLRLRYISRLEEHGPHLAVAYPQYLRLFDSRLNALDTLENSGRAFLSSGGQISDPSFAEARKAYQEFEAIKQKGQSFFFSRIGWRHSFASAASTRITAASKESLLDAQILNLAVTRTLCKREPSNRSCEGLAGLQTGIAESREEWSRLKSRADELESRARLQKDASESAD